MQTWAYLSGQKGEEFSRRAKAMNMTEGKLMQLLIDMFLTIPEETYQPINCAKCQYYHIATSQAIQLLMKVNEAFSLVPPSYKQVLAGRVKFNEKTS